MLAGGEATPYEITAAEVMLARWAGIPARIGFGFSDAPPRGELKSKVTTVPSDHVPLSSRAEAIVDLVVSAAR